MHKVTLLFFCLNGQKSIDFAIFFKRCLVGYLENIISDRQLITNCSLRRDILCFIGYDIDEKLRRHSTLRHPTQLYPLRVFGEVFAKFLGLCMNKGIVSFHAQAIDSVAIKVTTSMDRLELKVTAINLEAHLPKVGDIS